MKTLIIGLGKSGKAAYELLVEEGDEVVGFDDNAALIDQFTVEGKRADAHPDLSRFNRVVLSPGVPTTHPLYVEAERHGLETVGEAELALRRLQQPCIAVTGTNGKTTVTLLIEHVLRTAGRKVRALGNVGVPLTAYVRVADPEEIMVVELSSYQLETLYSARIDVGLLLNITPDHLDRYSLLREYAAAKCRLQELVKTPSSLWVHAEVAREFGDLLRPGFQTYGVDAACDRWTDRKALRKGEIVETILPIRYTHWGDHESENALAAWIACAAWGVDASSFSAALETFRKPAHRIEFVTAHGGVDYFDDSKGTNIDATIKAVEAMTGKVVLIAGGVDKGASYLPWKSVFAGRVKHILAIGQAAGKIAQELAPEFQVEFASNLREAVQRASARAEAGDAVLLSPGCASFDMFRGYAERGDKFKQYVLELGQRREE